VVNMKRPETGTSEEYGLQKRGENKLSMKRRGGAVAQGKGAPQRKKIGARLEKGSRKGKKGYVHKEGRSNQRGGKGGDWGALKKTCKKGEKEPSQLRTRRKGGLTTQLVSDL